MRRLQRAPVRKKEDSLEAYKEETADASDQPKKRQSNASVDPAKFNWDEFEKAADYGAPKEEVEKEYDNTFSKVIENEVVEGTVTAMTKTRGNGKHRLQERRCHFNKRVQI
jgi:hypothetical protein